MTDTAARGELLGAAAMSAPVAPIAPAEPVAAVEPVEPFSLLLVDDEPNILSALRRLLHGRGYRVHTAAGGAAGLELLAREPIDLVISDMRMPEMDGAEFLGKVRSAWPDTVRVLLTGYADIASTIEAINRGEIFRYISKPWDEAHLVSVIVQGLERKALEREKRRLEALTRRQNLELAELNRTLEEKVELRTAELKEAHTKLRAAFLNTIRAFSSVVEMRHGTMAGHSRRVAEHVRNIAHELKIPTDAAQEMFFAALLHDVGKIGLEDRVLAQPLPKLTIDQRQEYMKHPAKGQALLMAMESLQGAASIIRMHHERLDGTGYPDQLQGPAISHAARILAVADDYDEMINGCLLEKPCSPSSAREHLLRGRGRRYDARVVDTFLELLRPKSGGTHVPDRELTTDLLEPGMMLTRDLLSREGMLLLARDHVLGAVLIRQIRAYETSEDVRLTLFVRI
jgi:response regulator RpfG family c-di-GMP phosphodiesterase